jgi:hypothetical protein
MDGCEGTTKYDRILELCHNGFAWDSTTGDLPNFNGPHLARMREIIRDALEVSHLELLQEANSSRKPKSPPRVSAKRRKVEDADAAIEEPSAQFFLPPTPGTFTQPGPRGPQFTSSALQIPDLPEMSIACEAPGNDYVFDQGSQQTMLQDYWPNDSPDFDFDDEMKL